MKHDLLATEKVLRGSVSGMLMENEYQFQMKNSL